jgi:hypothetical protein
MFKHRAGFALFVAFITFVPVPFYMVFCLGIVPLLWIEVFFMRSLLTVFSSEGTVVNFLAIGAFGIGMFIVHSAINFTILFFVSVFLRTLLFRFFSRPYAATAAWLIIAVLGVASFFHIYVLRGENAAYFLNLWDLWVHSPI